MALNVGNATPFVNSQAFNGLVPKEGPRAVPIPLLNLTANPSQSFDFLLAQEQTRISMVQCIWVDNRQNTVPLQIAWDGVGMVTRIPARYQGFVPVLVLNPPKFTVTCPGGVAAQMTLLNVPMPAFLWATENVIPTYDSNGNLLVSDALLDAAISGSKVQVANSVRGNSDVQQPEFCSDKWFTGTRAAAGVTTIMTGAPGFYVTHFELGFTGNATLAAAASVVVDIRDNGVAIAQQDVFLPATGAAFALPLIRIMGSEHLNYISPNNAANLQVNLGTALSAGALWWRIGAGITATIRV